LGARTEARTEAETNSQWPPNGIVWFTKPDHPVLVVSGQKQTSRTTMPGTAPTPHWCPLGLMHSQRRRIQWVRAQKLTLDVAEKQRVAHFNTIWHIFLKKQEWRVKDKANIPAPTTSNDDMDLLDDDESPLIKNGSPPPIGMDINMVFMLPAEFRGAEEEVA
jgi:hypothetical protein